MRDMISIKDLSKADVEKIFRLTDKLKNKLTNDLKGKNIVLIFQKASTRTRVSFTVAINQMGGNAIVLNWNELQLGRGETIEDTARVLEGYGNALSDLEHPCQALADLYTIKQKKKKLKGLKIVFLGDGANNTFHSLIMLCQMFGMDIVVSCPLKYKPKMKGKYKIIEDPKKAVENASVLYTDAYVSMGEESQAKNRIKDLSKYQLNSRLVKLAKRDVIVMHPLPAHRGMEITDDVIDGKHSIVWGQAENRLHTEKAILYLLMK